MVVHELTEADVDRLFQALADATRRDIVARVTACESSVSELAGDYSMSFAAVQKHVAVLERAGLVTKRRRGREQIVHPDPAMLRRAAGLLDAYEAIWQSRAEQMSALLGATTQEQAIPQEPTLTQEPTNTEGERP